MPDVMGLPAFISRLHARHQLNCQAALILSCGGMIGSAMFFPFDAIGNHRYCDILVAIFVVSATVWHTLSLEALIDYGPYFFPSGLVVLLSVAILAGPARADLAAWLPISIVTLSFLTVATHARDIRQRHRPGNVTPNSHSDNDSQQRYKFSEPIYRFVKDPAGPKYFQQPSIPPATFTQKSIDTTLTLSSTPARARPSWGYPVLELFIDPAKFRGGQQPSRWPGQDTGADPRDRGDAALPDDGEDLPADPEHKMNYLLLGLNFLRPKSPGLGRKE